MLTKGEIERVPKLRHMLKNAITHHLLQNRKSKNPSSSMQFLKQAAKASSDKRKENDELEKEMNEKGLMYRLQTLQYEEVRITNDRFEMIKSAMNRFSSDLTSMKLFNTLRFGIQDFGRRVQE